MSSMNRVKAEAVESVKAWQQGDADPEAILREYGDIILMALNSLPELTKVRAFEPPSFYELVKGCTPEERTALAQRLAIAAAFTIP